MSNATTRGRRCLAGLVLGVLLLATGVADTAAAGELGRKFREDDHAQMSVRMVDGVLELRQGEGDEEVVVVNVEALGATLSDLVAEVMGKVRDSLVELDDLELAVRLDSDQRLEIETVDNCLSFDLEAVMAEVGAALETAFAQVEFDLGDLPDRVRSDVTVDPELRRELRRLQEQMRGLADDLRWSQRRISD